MVESASSFITPVRFAIASTPLSARITPQNCTQSLLDNFRAAVRDELRCQMRRADNDQRDHGQNCRKRQDHGETAAVLRSEKIDKPHDEKHANSRENDVLFKELEC